MKHEHDGDWHEHERGEEAHRHVDETTVEYERCYFGPPTGPIPDPRFVYRAWLRTMNGRTVADLQAAGVNPDVRAVLLRTLLDLIFTEEDRLVFDIEYEERLVPFLAQMRAQLEEATAETERRQREAHLLAPLRVPAASNGSGPNRQERRHPGRG